MTLWHHVCGLAAPSVSDAEVSVERWALRVEIRRSLHFVIATVADSEHFAVTDWAGKT